MLMTALLLTSLQGIASATFPGRNGAIAFVRGNNVSEISWRLWSMRPDGSHAHRLGEGKPRARGFPSWSPDGHRIAYLREGASDLWAMRADGSKNAMVGNWEAADPFSWSPDGTAIAFQAFVRSPRIGIVDATDGHRLFLSHLSDRFTDGQPAWSPDGRWIAFWRAFTGGSFCQHGAIMLMHPDGTDVRALVRHRHCPFGLDWAPDGSRLAFEEGGDLAEVSADTGQVTTLTHGGRDLYPAFSPDGKRIAFSRCCFGSKDRSKVFVMRSDGSHARTLAWGFDPSWQALPR